MAKIVLTLMLILQIADMKPMIGSRKDLINQQTQFTSIQSEEWETLIEDKDAIVVIPHDLIKNNYGIFAAYEIADFAIDHGIAINYFPVSRADEEALFFNDNEYAYALLNKVGGENYLYILDSESRAEAYGLKTYHIDGYIVGVCE